MRNKNSQLAFTLAELLIALAILGVIATFTIPKILDSGSNSQWNAIGKEAAAMVSGAYQSYKLDTYKYRLIFFQYSSILALN